jgi:cytochrome c-type biogenesis protein CcmF
LAVQAAAGRFGFLTTGGLLMTFWIVASLGAELKERLWARGASGAQVFHRARQLPLAMWGMMVAHLGVAAFAFGVSMVKTYETERDVKMGPGDSTEIGGYTFKMTGLREIKGPNYVAAQGSIEIYSGGQLRSTLMPEKRIYRVQQNPMTEAAVDSNPIRDLYISMGEQLPSGEWIVRVQHKPFIVFIWGGCLIMMAGGLLAMSDRRYRVQQRSVSASRAQEVAA